MKFKVSTKVKGSLILKSLGRAVSSGATVYIEGNTLYEDDIQRAIKTGLLVPLTAEAKIEVREKIINKSSEVVIINKTDRVVIIGNFPIRPNGSAIKDISQLDMNAIKNSVEKGLIQVITDVDDGLFDDQASIEKKIEPIIETKHIEPEKGVSDEVCIKKAQTKLEIGIEILEETSSKSVEPEDELSQLIKEVEQIESEEYQGEELSEDREDGSKSIVWDFREQKTKKPKIVPKTIQKMITEEKPDVDMVDALDEVNNVEDEEIKIISDKIENMKKKLAQKKASKKTSKKKESKSIKTKFTKESEDDIAQSLDSMGNPLSDDMPHMIDDANGNEISFCDSEQAQKNIDNARKQGNSINLDLD